MPWARVDDGFHGHPKVRRTSLAALGLWVRALSYVAHYETDGAIDEDTMLSLSSSRRGVRKLMDELLETGLLDRADDGGLRIHDYLDYNPSREEVSARRQSDVRRQALLRDPMLRAAIRERDAGRCRYCDRIVNWKDRRSPLGGSYDHVDPHGPNTMENLVVACRGCNSAKGSRTPDEAGMPLLPPAGAQTNLNGRVASEAI